VRTAVPFDEEGNQRPAAVTRDEDVRPAYELAVGSRAVSLDHGGLISRGLRPGRRVGGARRARGPHDQRGDFDAGEPPGKCAGRQRRIGSDHLQEPLAAERRPDVARARRLPYTCPLMPFTGLGLDPALLRATRELGFTRPTPVQQDAIPPALAGRDVLACAMTGSGKTAAFLLPIMQRLLAKRRGVTRALVLAPTRELAAQIDAHFAELAVHTALTGAAVFGGVGMGPQEHAFRSGVDVIVATPGRLLDHFRQPYAKLEDLDVLVLDEADRMLDMGFLPDIRRILRHLPRRRQTLFFSATIPPPIVGLAREMLRDPVTVNLERKAAP